ncbi:hypothetical protein C8Q78DRAFT_1082595 [Trametes maxima]|nr:hypothetical protein C8Q78DRAFT_1082595 [Trametes maxima]
MPSFRRAAPDAQATSTLLLPPTQTIIVDLYPEPAPRAEPSGMDVDVNAELASLFQAIHAPLPAATAGGPGFVVAPAFPPGEIDFSGMDFPELPLSAPEGFVSEASVDFAFLADAPVDTPAPHPAVASTSVGNVILAALAAEGMDFEAEYYDDMEVEELLDEEEETEEDEEMESKEIETEH